MRGVHRLLRDVTQDGFDERLVHRPSVAPTSSSGALMTNGHGDDECYVAHHGWDGHLSQGVGHRVPLTALEGCRSALLDLPVSVARCDGLRIVKRSSTVLEVAWRSRSALVWVASLGGRGGRRTTQEIALRFVASDAAHDL